MCRQNTAAPSNVSFKSVGSGAIGSASFAHNQFAANGIGSGIGGAGAAEHFEAYTSLLPSLHRVFLVSFFVRPLYINCL